MYCYSPEHPLANGAGKVMEHTYVMVNHIGRLLYPNECVHHIDRNRANNDISNLQLLTNSEHSKLHALEDGKITITDYACKRCSTTFKGYPLDNRIYCSSDCAKLDKRKFDISPEELRSLVWTYPTTRVAEMLGVSDTAVAKRCKLLGIDKPTRGYWAKKRASKL